MRVRTMHKDDVSKVYRLGIEQKEFSTVSGNFWSEEQLATWCGSPNDVLLVAEDALAIVGFSLYAVHIPTGKVTWENLYVHPSVRGRGIGKTLIHEGHTRLMEKGYSYVVLHNHNKDQEKFAQYLQQFGFKTGDKMLWLDQYLTS